MQRILAVFLIGLASVAVQAQDNKPTDLVTVDLGKDHFAAGHLLPGFGNVIGMLESRPGMSALLGFALLVCIPIASLILLITLIGAPLALLSIAAYFALLLVGYLAAAAAMGDLLLKRLRHGTAETVGWRIVAAICGIFIIALLGRIPVLGGLIVFMALIMGIGAVALQMTRALRPAVH